MQVILAIEDALRQIVFASKRQAINQAQPDPTPTRGKREVKVSFARFSVPRIIIFRRFVGEQAIEDPVDGVSD